MKKTVGKTLWLIAGILLIFVGVVAMFSPTGVGQTIAFVLGVALLMAGIFDFVVYFLFRETVFGQKWVLMSGVLNLVLAALLLCNTVLASNAIAYLFAMWSIVSGINRFITALELKRVHMTGWIWLAILGICAIAVGFLSFFEPVVSLFAMGLIIGVTLILYGATLLVLWWYMQQMES